MKVAILTNIIPTYRSDFYEKVFANKDHEVTVFCQDTIPGSNVKSIHETFKGNFCLVKYYAPFNNESLVFHFLPIIKLWRDYDVLVIDGNIRNVTQALLSSVFRLFGKKIVLWSNVQTFNGNRTLQKIRLNWWRIFSNFLMYTEKDAQLLKELGFTNKNIISINNGLNQDFIENIIQKCDSEFLSNFKEKHQIKSNAIVISSGRVNKVNNHILALESIKKVKETIPDILWIVIGDGSEMESLKKAIVEYDLSENVLLLGEVYDEEQKAPWFLISKLFVHPGPIGLSIFNAFGYSLPVITHDNENNHGPEFYLFEENKTGFLFKEEDSDDLAKKILLALESPENMADMKNYTNTIVRDKNNTSIMSRQFLQMINSLT